LAIGNGTAGDFSGALTLKVVNISDTGANADLVMLNTTAATALTTNASPLQEFSVYYDNAGTFTGLDTWSIGSSVAVGNNGASTLTIAHSGSTGAVYINLPATAQLTWAGAPIIRTTSGNTLLNLYQNTTELINFAVSGTQVIAQPGQGGYGFEILGALSASGAASANAAVVLGNAGSMVSTSGTAVGIATSLTFNPASGTASFIGCNLVPTIEGTSSGNTTALVVNPTLTATNLTGTNLIASFQSAGTHELDIGYSGNLIWSEASNPAGISYLGAASLAIGNGTAGDYT
jgi:hypothetical protein